MATNVSVLEPATGGTIVVGDTVPLALTATITATNSESIDGVTVDWKINNEGQTGAGTGSVTPVSSTTDQNGKATTNLTATVAGDIVISAYTSDDTVDGGKSITIVASEASAGDNIVSACTTLLNVVNIDQDNLLPSVITATVQDTDGNPVAEVGVSWTVENGTLSSETSITDTNGNAKVSVTASAAGVVSVTAKTAGDDTGKTANILAKASSHPAPLVPNATATDGFTLNQFDIHQGVFVEVRRYPASPGDLVTLFWGENSAQFIVNNAEDDLPHTISVTDAFPATALADGEHWVHYQIDDIGGNPSLSEPLRITVAQGGETLPSLPEPSVPDADGDNIINELDALDGVNVIISDEDMAAGDVVTLYWNGYTNSNNHPIPNASTTIVGAVSSDGTLDLDPFTLSRNLFYPLNGEGYEGRAEAFYTVQPADGGELALSQTLTVFVDTVPSIHH